MSEIIVTSPDQYDLPLFERIVSAVIAHVLVNFFQIDVLLALSFLIYLRIINKATVKNMLTVLVIFFILLVLYELYLYFGFGRFAQPPIIQSLLQGKFQLWFTPVRI